MSESGTGSWGFIIRDSEGDVVLTGRGKLQNLLSAFQAKLIVCLHGVQLALQLGIGNLILETDALLVQLHKMC
jgi:ribonuclease HI